MKLVRSGSEIGGRLLLPLGVLLPVRGREMKDERETTPVARSGACLQPQGGLSWCRHEATSHFISM